MYFDEPLIGKTETKPDVFSLESLIAWLEKQPATAEYCYMDTGGCLLGSYYRAMGFKQIEVGGMSVTLDGQYQEMPDDFSDIPVGFPRTYGAALKRTTALSRARTASQGRG